MSDIMTCGIMKINGEFITMKTDVSTNKVGVSKEIYFTNAGEEVEMLSGFMSVTLDVVSSSSSKISVQEIVNFLDTKPKVLGVLLTTDGYMFFDDTYIFAPSYIVDGENVPFNEHIDNEILDYEEGEEKRAIYNI